MTPGPVDVAYAALGALMLSDPRLMAFAGWPEAVLAARPARDIPAAQLVYEWPAADASAAGTLHDAIRAMAALAEWHRTYTEAEVGADFLARYGWFELVGPTGHYQTDGLRAYIAYWGAGLTYDWHLHEAEELYYILAGEAVFLLDGEEPATLRPSDIRFHGTNQPHAMITTDSAVLTLVLWRGAGLTGIPRMGRI